MLRLSAVILVPFSGPCETLLKQKPQMVQFNIAPQPVYSWTLTMVYFFSLLQQLSFLESCLLLLTAKQTEGMLSKEMSRK